MRYFEVLDEISRWKASGWIPPSQDVNQRLQKYKKPGYYLSFTSMNTKLGINPQPIDDITPYGIFAYRVTYALGLGLLNIPYAGEKPYIWVFTARNPKRIKTIKQVGDKAWEIYVSGRQQAVTLGMMNKFFLKKKIDAFIDEGTGTIHPHEPYQAVFFGSQTINPVEVINNTLGKEYEKQQFTKDASGWEQDNPWEDNEEEELGYMQMPKKS